MRPGHTGGVFSQIGGLPLHPLVVHAVVVLLPLSTLGALAVAARPRWARAYGPLVALGAVVAAVAALVAKEAGEALERQLAYTGEAAVAIAEHGRWGLYTVNLGAAFAVLTVVAVVLARRAGDGDRAHRVVQWLAVAVGIAATVFTFLAGESGAASRWGFVFA